MRTKSECNVVLSFYKVLQKKWDLGNIYGMMY